MLNLGRLVLHQQYQVSLHLGSATPLAKNLDLPNVIVKQEAAAVIQVSCLEGLLRHRGDYPPYIASVLAFFVNFARGFS